MKRRGAHRAMRVGVFGLLGTGNLGNDASFEAVLAFLRERYPNATVDCRCGGPAYVEQRYGVAASPLNAYGGEYRTASTAGAIVGKAVGKLVDAVRTARWVRRHDVVIVPGMGVLEATLPLRPWGFPYSLLLLCVAGRVFGTTVALVGVGADVVGGAASRRVLALAARLARYRSYRDELSRDAMRAMGVDTSADGVFPDLAFALPTPEPTSGPTGAVGVGVMDFRGGDGDRHRADELHAAYVGALVGFIRWLVASGRTVRLFVGDHVDDAVAAKIVAEVGSPAVSAPKVSTMDELQREMATVDSVVATRYHNVVCALRLGKPTISVGYAAKNHALMASMGLGPFCLSAYDVTGDRLVALFTELVSSDRAPDLAERNRAAARGIEAQFAELSAAVLAAPPARPPVPAGKGA
ncbi:hypothetical protein SacmaDRAFT_0593 [Saccharomonospora marina XMU15]|uniref:Polysaccharide pyruvyl transferase domain-containing protein n=1 Tax=Saccharomonospora marina XMU15 TaxID=882083 RepID=H5X583_9PSEU|nr:polysaccharide pyruvyl transferase family protein [Saccharomonospora marina]EHR48894.1 hypothetical protein SacmaDRAFT_0593 [Saccharomonospora marina XMU15]